MKRAAVTFAAVALPILLAACDRGASESPNPAAAADELLIPEANDNVAALVNGAVVVHRTGETNLALSAIRAIDSDPESWWGTPPGDISESMTLALRSPSTIRRIGYSTGIVRSAALASGLRFESSLDGVSFSELGTVRLDEPGEAWEDVSPTRAAFLRVSNLPPMKAGAELALVPAVLARGDAERTSIDPRTIEGTWNVNEIVVTFERSIDAVRGWSNEATTRGIDGGWDDGIVRFAFSRGNEVGIGVIVPDSRGEHLNAMMWFRRTGPPHFGTTWFGSRSTAGPVAAEMPNVMDAYLRNESRFPLFGLSFEERRLRPGSIVTVRRLVSLLQSNPPGLFRFRAHQAGLASEQEDRQLAEAKLQALREALQSAGADPARAEFVAGGRAEAVREPDTPWPAVQRRLNNRIDLELVRAEPPR